MSINNHPTAGFSEHEDGQSVIQQTCKQLKPIFRKFTEADHMPSVVFGVVVDTKLVFTDALGTRIAGQQLIPDKNTVYRIASMTKSFTAAAVLSLRDAGKLKLDDAIATWVPELDLTYPTATAPTSRYVISSQCRLVGRKTIHGPTVSSIVMMHR